VPVEILVYVIRRQTRHAGWLPQVTCVQALVSIGQCGGQVGCLHLVSQVWQVAQVLAQVAWQVAAQVLAQVLAQVAWQVGAQVLAQVAAQVFLQVC
jgi:hypothetical protein